MASETPKIKDTGFIPSHRVSELRGGVGHSLDLNFKKN